MWASITAMLLAGFWCSSANPEFFLEIVLCAGVIPVTLGTIRPGMPRWAVGFVAIALGFNPIVPGGLSQTMTSWLELICVAAFLGSLAVIEMFLATGGIFRKVCFYAVSSASQNGALPRLGRNNSVDLVPRNSFGSLVTTSFSRRRNLVERKHGPERCPKIDYTNERFRF